MRRERWPCANGSFMEQVAAGEALFAQGPANFLQAAVAFFRALKVYPAPMELVMIYQKAVPKEVFDIIMKLVARDVSGPRKESTDRRRRSTPTAAPRCRRRRTSMRLTTTSRERRARRTRTTLHPPRRRSQMRNLRSAWTRAPRGSEDAARMIQCFRYSCTKDYRGVPH